MKFHCLPAATFFSVTLGLLEGCTPKEDPTPRPPDTTTTGGRGGGGRGGSAGTGGTGGSPTAGTGGSSAGGTGGSTGGSGGSAGGAGGSATAGTGGSTAYPDAGGGGDAASTVGDAPPSTGNPPVDNPGAPTNLPDHKFTKVIKMNTTASGAPVTGNVAKYPVAVQLNAMNFDFAQAKPAGEDIRFATPEGALLPYAIELWDATSKQAAIWVKVDVKGNDANQSIVMHWGNPNAVSASNSKGVFSMADGFLGVYHLDQDGNNAPDHYKDSSANEAHMTGFAMEPGNSVAARVGKGIRLDNPGGMGKNQWLGVTGPKVDVPFNASAERPISATAWAYGETFGGYYETVMSKGDTSWTLQRDYQGRMEACTWSGSYHSCAITGAPPVKRWVHYMVVQTTSRITLFVDGRQAASTGSFNRTGMHGFAIAHNYQSNANAATGKREWHGMFDEVRVMAGGKDVNWALLDFHSQKEGSTFLSFGPTMMK